MKSIMLICAGFGIWGGLLLAEEPVLAEAAKPVAEVRQAVEKWLGEMDGKIYKATFRAADGDSPMQAKPVSGQLYAAHDGGVAIGIGFTKPLQLDTTLDEVKAAFKHIALDRIPVPGIHAENWRVGLQSPVSSFAEGVTIESWADGVLAVRVQTSFFAAHGVRTDILVPADAGQPEGTYFQIRKPIKADLLIQMRLMPGKDGLVTWKEMAGIIKANRLNSAGQLHNLTAFITTADGHSYKAIEPEIDLIFKLIKESGHPPPPMMTE